MQFDPELWLRIKDKKVTAHQIRILSDLATTHSQTQSAVNLGISVPVLHRHIRSLAGKLELKLVETTPNGTWLTNDGQLLLRIYNRYQDMLKPDEGITIYCTPITYDLVKKTIVSFEIDKKSYRISINNDLQNLKALYHGRADLVIFDDPAFAIEFEGFKEDKILTTDIFQDTLIFKENGPKFIKLKYGAQRLGYRYLEANKIKYKVLTEVSDFDYLVSSDKSYFLNQSLVIKNNLNIKSMIDPIMFSHPIMAVSINPLMEIREITGALKEIAKEIFNYN
jgi:molybdenum-dependent DNA-binding transcriptional regulator ModE